MELFCCENAGENPRAEIDPVIMANDTVLEWLLANEDRYTVTCNYFRFVQKELTHSMRRICVRWMMEVCEEEKCENSVFPVAVNYLDRFLSVVSIRKEHVQLVAAVCLLMASKVRQTNYIDPQKLSYYTDYAYHHNEIKKWEVLVLSRLKWDTSSVIPFDFLDLVLSRLPLGEFRPVVRKHALVFLQVCAAELKFCSWTASLFALGCIGAAINGLPNVKSLWLSPQELYNFFQEMTAIEVNIVEHCIREVEEQIASHVLNVLQEQQGSGSERQTTNESLVPCPLLKESQEQYRNNYHSDMDGLELQPETPTDVQDVIV